MQILHINCNYIGTTLHQLMVENLDKLGHKSEVFVPTYDKNTGVIVPNENVYVCECFRKWDRLFFDYKQSKIYKGLKKRYQLKNFQLIHAYTLFTDGNCARKLSKEYNLPYVVAIRNTDVNTFFRYMPHLRGRGIKIMRDAAAVFFLSETYRKQVFEKYIPKRYQEEIANKSHVVPNGIDDFWFEHPTESEKIVKKQLKLVYAGKIDKNKNIPTTQKAMEILRDRGYDVSLTVVGKIMDEKEFSLIRKDEHTTYISAKPKEELIEIYRQHDIFVMPSFTESFGLVYVEAMSQGLPVVYSAGQGFDAQFTEGTVGYRAESHSPEAVADAIDKIAKNYTNISKNVAECANKFKWNTITNYYNDIYQEVETKHAGIIN